MFRHPSDSLRAVAFILLTCVCLIGTDSWRSWNARTVELREMGVAASNLSRAAAQQAEDVIKQTDTALVGIVERVEYEGTGSVALARLHRLMAMRIAELQQLNGLFVYDAQGSWLATSQPTLVQTFNNSDREYFVFHRAHTDRGPHIGLPVRSRSTGKWIIPVSRRIDRADGSFAGVALATIDIGFFSEFYDSLDIGHAGAIALVLENGIMLMRRPFTDTFVGKDIRDTGLFQAYRNQGPVSTVILRSSQDGVVRLNSFRRLRHYPVFVAAALSKDEMLTDWWRDTLVHSAGVALLVATVSFFGWRLVQQIRSRTRTEAELIRTQQALTLLNGTLERLAMQDGLTGLANRRQFDTTLCNEFTRATRHASALALVMLDVDCFKQYNDIYGHAAGDECLRAISEVIQGLTPGRPGDLVARYGGEELVVLLPGTDAAGATVVARKILRAVYQLQLPHAGSPAGVVTVSAGVESMVPERGSDTPASLIKAVDKALYAAKASGRNRVCSLPLPERPAV
jgi:diguanylate cyclase (GGDEF)-like protein